MYESYLCRRKIILFLKGFQTVVHKRVKIISYLEGKNLVWTCLQIVGDLVVEYDRMSWHVYDIPKDYKDWIGFRQVFYLSLLSQEVYKYMTTPVGCWERSVVLVVVNTGGAACAVSWSVLNQSDSSKVKSNDWIGWWDLGVTLIGSGASFGDILRSSGCQLVRYTDI